MVRKTVSIEGMIKKIEVSVRARQSKFEGETVKPAGPFFSFLIGAGFSVTAGVSSVNHLVAALERFRSSRDTSWQEIFDHTFEDSLGENELSGPEITDYYFHLISEVLPLPQARHDFITAAIQWASSRSVQMNIEGILLATILIAGTGGVVPLYSHRKKRHWLARAFARHAFTTNFDEVMPNTFYYGNHPVEIIDTSGARPVSAAAEYPTVAYLHGRHLHYDIRNTPGELHTRRDHLGFHEEDLLQGFRSLLRSTGLIVIGYSGAKDQVTRCILEALDDPESLPYGLWWVAYPDESAVHEDVQAAIQQHERAFYLEPRKDAEQVLRLLCQRIGIDEVSAIGKWTERLQVVSEAVDRFLKRASYDFHKFQLEATQALMLSSEEMTGKVLDDWNKMRDHVLDHGDKAFVADLLSRVARLMVLAGDVAGAEKTYQEAIELLERMNAPGKLGNTVLGYGEFRFLQGDYRQAESSFHQALELLQEANRRLDVAKARSRIGDVLLVKGEVDKAEEEFSCGLAICLKAKYTLGMGQNLVGLAEVALLRKDHDSAIQQFTEALELHRKDGSEVHMIRDLRGLGRAWFQRGDHESARCNLIEALELARENGLKREIAHTLATLSDVQRTCGELEAAEKGLEESIQLFGHCFDAGGLRETNRIRELLDQLEEKSPEG